MDQIGQYLEGLMEPWSEKYFKIDRGKYSIRIREIYYHRGMIPLLSGDVSVRLGDEYFKNRKGRFSMEEHESAVEMFEYLHLFDYMHGYSDIAFPFTMSYVEFLHPGSGNYGLNVYFGYINAVDFQEFVNNLDEGERGRRARSIYKRYLEIVNKTNNCIAEAEEIIAQIRDKMEEMIIQDMEGEKEI
jgi:hypothetical protein